MLEPRGGVESSVRRMGVRVFPPIMPYRFARPGVCSIRTSAAPRAPQLRVMAANQRHWDRAAPVSSTAAPRSIFADLTSAAATRTRLPSADTPVELSRSKSVPSFSVTPPIASVAWPSSSHGLHLRRLDVTAHPRRGLQPIALKLAGHVGRGNLFVARGRARAPPSRRWPGNPRGRAPTPASPSTTAARPAFAPLNTPRITARRRRSFTRNSTSWFGKAYGP